MPEMLSCVSSVYTTLFDRYLLCPIPSSKLSISPEYLAITSCSNHNRSLLLKLLCSVQILKVNFCIEEIVESQVDEDQLLDFNDTVDSLYSECSDYYFSMDSITRAIAATLLEEYAYASDNRIFTLAILSFLIEVSSDIKYVDMMIHEAIKDDFSTDQKLFVFNQLKRLFLIHPELQRVNLLDDLYTTVLENWRASLENLLLPIPVNMRNKNRSIVLTLQFLGLGHAPTKTACERIYTLGKQMNRELLCINTREQYTLKGYLPFYHATIREIVKDYTNHCKIAHKDYEIDFVQPTCEMPDFEEMKVVLQQIRNYAPWQVIVLGDKCLMGDLCAEIIPTVCIPMAFSTIPKKKNQYVAIGRHLTVSDKQSLKESSYPVSSIIESTFTFELTKQTKKLTRPQLHLPQDRFLVVIVGTRLDSEIKDDFIHELSSTFVYGAHLVFAGIFNRYEAYCDKDPLFLENSTYVGYQDDILALMENCNLYVNPPRIGGGFSVVEAFFKGLPGITLNYGDVAASAGPDFCVDTLSEMANLIRRYIEDSSFYQQMSQKAMKRSKELFDSQQALEYILKEMEHRELWF